jgi:hypothetical protein
MAAAAVAMIAAIVFIVMRAQTLYDGDLTSPEASPQSSAYVDWIGFG